MTRSTWAFVIVALVAIGIGVWWTTRAPSATTDRDRSTTNGSASSDPSYKTPRMRREELRQRILSAILDEAAMPSIAEEEAQKKLAAKGDDTNEANGGREERILTLGLTGVPAVNFPTEYIADISRDHLRPLTRKCLENAQTKRPDAGGLVTIRYVVVAAPNVGGIVEDATVDESSLDDDFEECIRESALTLTFDRAPAQGGWKEASFVMNLEPDGG